MLKCLNFWFDWKAITTELVLVPLGLSKGLHQYEKGRADNAAVEPAHLPHFVTLDALLQPDRA